MISALLLVVLSQFLLWAVVEVWFNVDILWMRIKCTSRVWKICIDVITKVSEARLPHTHARANANCFYSERWMNGKCSPTPAHQRFSIICRRTFILILDFCTWASRDIHLNIYRTESVRDIHSVAAVGVILHEHDQNPRGTLFIRCHFKNAIAVALDVHLLLPLQQHQGWEHRVFGIFSKFLAEIGIV